MTLLGINGRGELKKRFAKRSLGQNFLVDGNYVRKIVDCLGNLGSSHVIEIGPGRGALTAALAGRAAFLTAIELDTEFAKELGAEYRRNEAVRILEEDVLDSDIPGIAAAGGIPDVKIVANLPYNISTPVLRKLCEVSRAFASAVLMMQKEVAERISARAGDRNRGYLTVLIEAYFASETLFVVPPTAFRPVPKVLSAVVRLTPRKAAAYPDNFKAVLSAGFGQKRKTIANNLKSIAGNAKPKALLASLGIESNLRPDALTLEQWKSLAIGVSEI